MTQLSTFRIDDTARGFSLNCIRPSIGQARYPAFTAASAFSTPETPAPGSCSPMLMLVTHEMTLYLLIPSTRRHPLAESAGQKMSLRLPSASHPILHTLSGSMASKTFATALVSQVHLLPPSFGQQPLCPLYWLAHCTRSPPACISSSSSSPVAPRARPPSCIGSTFSSE